jgi:hypothetical protein
MIVYFYDLKAKAKDYNRIKRVFYYRLSKLGFNKYFWKTKSVLVVPNNMERAVDSFFKEHTKICICYKIHCKEIKELE